jgi:F-type H+-transporting ATPase subunit a
MNIFVPILANLMEHVLPHFYQRQEGQPPPPFALSNHIVMMFIAAALVLITFVYVGVQAKRNIVPHGTHNFFESILSFLRTELIRPALRENADRFTPFIWTVFFFILFCNLLGLIPVNEIVTFVRSIGKSHEQIAHMTPTHIWGTATANFAVTGALAVVAFFAIHISGVTQQIRLKMNPALDPHHHPTADQAHHGPEDHGDHLTHHEHALPQGQAFPVAFVTGIGSYVWNFAPHPQIGNKVIDILIYLALLVLETAGAFVKPFALCVRLFANMVAGHMVLAALVGIIPFAAAAYLWGPISILVVAGCTALSLLELFVAFLQAYIFAFLTTLFIASAVAPEH